MLLPTTKRHWVKYDTLCKEWGVKITEDKFFGLTREQMREKFRQDPYLNNVGTLRRCDVAAAHLQGKPHHMNIDGENDGRRRYASNAEANCALKHAVKVWCGLEPVFVEWNDSSLKRDYPRRDDWG